LVLKPKFKLSESLSQKVKSPIVARHIGSHSITCYQTPENSPSQANQKSIYPLTED